MEMTMEMMTPMDKKIVSSNSTQLVFEQTSIVIGRSRECELSLSSESELSCSVSKKHVKIYPCVFGQEVRWFLKDLDSKHGTSVNGDEVKRGTSIELFSGDVIVLAKFVGDAHEIKCYLEGHGNSKIVLETKISLNKNALPMVQASTSILSSSEKRKHIKDKREFSIKKRFRALENQDKNCGLSPLKCPVCFEYFIESMTLSCSHTFCSCCLQHWLLKSLSCPTCRVQVSLLPVRTRTIDDLCLQLVDPSNPTWIARQETYKAELDANHRKALKIRRHFLELMDQAWPSIWNVWHNARDREAFVSKLSTATGVVRLAWCEAVGLSEVSIATQSSIKLLNALCNILPHTSFSGLDHADMKHRLRFGYQSTPVSTHSPNLQRLLDSIDRKTKTELFSDALDTCGNELFQGHESWRDQLLIKACRLDPSFVTTITDLARPNGTSNSPLILSGEDEEDEAEEDDEDDDGTSSVEVVQEEEEPSHSGDDELNLRCATLLMPTFAFPRLGRHRGSAEGSNTAIETSDGSTTHGNEQDEDEGEFEDLGTPPTLPVQKHPRPSSWDVRRKTLVTDIGDNGVASLRYTSLKHQNGPHLPGDAPSSPFSFRKFLHRRGNEEHLQELSTARRRNVHPIDAHHGDAPIARYLQEQQRYTFAIILRNTCQVRDHLRQKKSLRSFAYPDLTVQVAQLHQKICKRLVQAGVGLILLDNDSRLEDRDFNMTPQMKQFAHTDNICILIDPYKDKDLLAEEFKREKDEWAIKQGKASSRLSENSHLSNDLTFSPALELQLTQNIIMNALKEYDTEAWVLDMQNSLSVHDVIEMIFPLHDRVFNEEFFAEYRKRTFEINISKATRGNSERWAIEELRFHFGERVAFLFAFMHIYSKLLLPMMMIFVIYYLALRFLPGPVWMQYIQGLAVVAFLASAIWAPTFLVMWHRETQLLVEKWNIGNDIKNKESAFDVNDENPLFRYTWQLNPVTNKMDKMPIARKKTMIQAVMFGFVGASIVLQSLFTLPFIQWYVFAKTVATCDECLTKPSNVCITMITCFQSPTSALGTDRWFYILLQGAALGLLIDIVFFELFNWLSAKFVEWENYTLKSEYEDRLIQRRFLFVWMNWFFWFLFLAFVYLPFGEQAITYLQSNNPNVPEFIRTIFGPIQWNASVLTLDTLFVTPLVITQVLNMLMETVIPYLVRKCRGKPIHFRNTCLRDMSDKAASWFCTSGLALTNTTTNKSAKELSQAISVSTRFFIPVMFFSDDSNGYTAYNIIAESKLTEFDPTFDYLDAAIQFSYVVMFTVVWPLLPLPAFLNNVLEVRGDAFRLLFVNRRPMPRRDVSIGEWATALSYANIIGITVVAGLIAVYHFPYFVTDCNFEFSDAVMVPMQSIPWKMAINNATCGTDIHKQSWVMPQVIVFVLLEHLAFCLRYLVLQFDRKPSRIGNASYQRLKQIESLEVSKSAYAEQFECLRQMRLVFDKYDVNRTDHISSPEVLQLFVSEWVGKPPSSMLSADLLFQYMDKNQLGYVSFSTVCLLLIHVHHDRFLSRLLGISDWMEDFQSAGIQAADYDGIKLSQEWGSVVSNAKSTYDISMYFIETRRNVSIKFVLSTMMCNDSIKYVVERIKDTMAHRAKATTFAQAWLKDTAAYPIIGVIAGACLLSAGASVRYLTKCPHVHWNKENRMSPIRDNVNETKWNSHRDPIRLLSENRINSFQEKSKQ
ncbi:transmembrane protein [Thraustotheca clavata]|uniref:E3 ubiquitin-protein ligase CHFR n=1 Tax=Thraustotheca clavata TaxID=74557 RepID=A0A1V9Z2Q0_9STRA|nr:transmembrane protein [Thraustotheca clavata]